MALDSGGNTRIDFVWGNKPVDPAGTREDAFYPAAWGGYPDAPPAGVTVPDLRGKSFAAADTQLEGLGLDSVVAVGTQNPPVWGQYPTPGSVVQPGTKVALTGTPSTSDSAQKVTVPNVVGQSNATAKANLAAVGLVGTGAVGTVAVQNPAAAASVALGTSVALT
jgi:beta-lactam-binding protein with PASTA domain